jgi:hypothetical protein
LGAFDWENEGSTRFQEPGALLDQAAGLGA